jgi:hypothetical protein
MSHGRPTSLDPETAARVCEAVLDGRTLREIEADPAMPSRATILRWAAEHATFGAAYARAREASAHAFADDVTDLARAVVAGRLEPDRARVAIDAAKWTAGRRAPKVYGARLAIEGQPMALLTDEALDRRIAELQAELYPATTALPACRGKGLPS